ncbi:hypothetical protein HDU96_006039 [Phlyctochytrium bullatum]|nr:hypothetical protein HDU96_006039 [Phlyctochytrium bullatum]
MESDLKFLSQLNATAYRFSISWPRILPDCTGRVNQEGIDFYNRMIDNIIANGAEPYLTMFHWDLPQRCQDDFGGFGNPAIVPAFLEYAKVLFKHFGDRVTYWLTLNEPEANCKFGWEKGQFAPGVKGNTCDRIRCLKYSYLAHGEVVKFARSAYPEKGWKFGLPSIVSAFAPRDEGNPEDVKWAEFAQKRDLGWFFDPTVFGDWGNESKTDGREEGRCIRETPFTATETTLLRNTSDFIALNYYSAAGIFADPTNAGGYGDYNPLEADASTRTGEWTSVYASGSSWQVVYARGLRRVLRAVQTRYPPGLDVHVTEVGYAGVNEAAMTRDEAVANPERTRFWKEHLEELRKAVVEDGVPVKAMLCWAIMDNFEWIQYESKFGQIHVDFSSPNRTRTIKNATYFIRDFFKDAKSPFPPRAPVALSSTTTALAPTSGAISSAVPSSTGVATTSVVPSLATSATVTPSGGVGRCEGAWTWVGAAVAVVLAVAAW